MRQLLWPVALICSFLSLWIVLPGPNLFFLRLAVAAPEISPLLASISAIALFFILLNALTNPRNHSNSSAVKGLTLLLLLTLSICAWPMFQRPSAIAAANQSMAEAFDQSQPIDAPFRWRAFFGRAEDRKVRVEDRKVRAEDRKVRSQKHIAFESPTGVPLSLDLYQPALYKPDLRKPALRKPDLRKPDLSQPLAAGRYPAVVTIYGGSWMRGSPAESQQMAEFLAARGYVVVALDYRHAPAHQFPAQIEDIAAGLAFVQSRAEDFEIDKERIALLGWSAGAHLAMLLGFQPALQSGGSVRSIVNYYGPVDLANGYYDIPRPDPIDVRQVLRTFLGGTPAELPNAYAAASPISYVEQAEANTLPAMLLIYGGRDHVVEARFGRALYNALERSGNRAVWVEIPWAEHAFDKVFNGLSNQMALPFIEQFLAQTLK